MAQGHCGAWGTFYGPQVFRSFTKPAEVIRQSRGFIFSLKAARGPKNPEFIEPVGLIFFPRQRARFLLSVLAKNFAGGCVHKVDLLTHHTRHRLIRILFLRNLFGGPSLNAEARVRAAVDEGGHCANDAIRTGGALICVNQSAKAMTYSSFAT